jgi:hypothetical protein
MSPSVKNAEAGATFVGALTTAIGVSLLVAPVRTGKMLGVQVDRERRTLQILGAVDLTVAIGLLFGRPRWPWMAARAVCNPPTAVYLGLLGRRSESRTLYAVASVVLLATVADAAAVRTLRAAGR